MKINRSGYDWGMITQIDVEISNCTAFEFFVKIKEDIIII